MTKVHILLYIKHHQSFPNADHNVFVSELNQSNTDIMRHKGTCDEQAFVHCYVMLKGSQSAAVTDAEKSVVRHRRCILANNAKWRVSLLSIPAV